MRGNGKILIIDSCQKNAQLVRQILEEMNIQAFCAFSKNELLSLISDQDFSLILLDARALDNTDFKIANILTKDDKVENVPIIFISSVDVDARAIIVQFKDSSVDFAFRPIEPEVLKCKVKIFIDFYNNKYNLQELIDDKVMELKEAYELLKISKTKAEAGNRIKSEFLANMSHELRTPMHGILCFAKFGMNDAKSERPNIETLISHFEEISSSGLRLMRLLNDILDISKLESGKMDYDRQYNDIRDVINQSFKDFMLLAREKEVEFKQISKIENYIGHFDSLKIQQVLGNLISNAIKFSHEKSIIEVSLTFCEKKGSQFIQVSVINEGVTIPEEDIEHIFDKFVQCGKNKVEGGGTGLGLAISKRIVRDHDGDIWIENSTNGKTVFNFTIPLEKVKKRILIVDDDEKILIVLKRFVEKEGFEVVCSSSAKEALSLLDKNYFLGIITDISMDGIDGIEFAGIVREKIPDIKIAFVSGAKKLMVSNANIIKLGKVVFIKKPIDKEKVKEFLESINSA